jgi:hypothetical protein
MIFFRIFRLIWTKKIVLDVKPLDCFGLLLVCVRAGQSDIGIRAVCLVYYSTDPQHVVL